MARSLNKVQLIGNLTRDPEMRYTPQGTAVCTFGLATNREWKTESGEKKEDAEFHNLVAWNKLAEICAQLLKKGRKVYVEGRLSTRSWQGQDGAQKQRTEVVISDMIILDKKVDDAGSEIDPDKIGVDIPEPAIESQESAGSEPKSKAKSKKDEKATSQEVAEQPGDEDIPF